MGLIRVSDRPLLSTIRLFVLRRIRGLAVPDDFSLYQRRWERGLELRPNATAAAREFDFREAMAPVAPFDVERACFEFVKILYCAAAFKVLSLFFRRGRAARARRCCGARRGSTNHNRCVRRVRFALKVSYDR